MAIFSELNSFLDFAARVKSWFSKQCSENHPDTPVERFVKLFEAHGIHRNQIPRYFPESLSLSVVQSDEKLSEILDQKLIDSASELFGVNPEWIECASSQVYRPLDFYKYPIDFLDFIDSILARGSRLKGVVFTSGRRGTADQQDTFLLLIESFETPQGLPLERYHLLNDWHFNYGKSRAYLALCVTAAWNRKAYVHGRLVGQKLIEECGAGFRLLGSEITESWPGEHWYPEDLGLDPALLINALPSHEDMKTALEIVLKERAKDARLIPSELSLFNRVSTFREALNSLKKEG